MKRFILTVCIISASLFLAVNLFALGVGAYGGISPGSTTWSISSDTDETNNMAFEGGFVLDTNLSKDQLFNYRLNIGFGSFTAEPESGDDLELYRLIVSNTFGFGIVRTEQVRFWMGPQISLMYITGDYSYSYTFMTTTYNVEREYSMGGASFGLSVGLNINPGDLVTIALEGGIRGTVAYGQIDETKTSTLPSSSSGTIDAVMYGYEGYANIAFLVRFGE